MNRYLEDTDKNGNQPRDKKQERRARRQERRARRQERRKAREDRRILRQRERFANRAIRKMGKAQRERAAEKGTGAVTGGDLLGRRKELGLGDGIRGKRQVTKKLIAPPGRNYRAKRQDTKYSPSEIDLRAGSSESKQGQSKIKTTEYGDTAKGDNRSKIVGQIKSEAAKEAVKTSHRNYQREQQKAEKDFEARKRKERHTGKKYSLTDESKLKKLKKGVERVEKDREGKDIDPTNLRNQGLYTMKTITTDKSKRRVYEYANRRDRDAALSTRGEEMKKSLVGERSESLKNKNPKYQEKQLARTRVRKAGLLGRKIKVDQQSNESYMKEQRAKRKAAGEAEKEKRIQERIAKSEANKKKLAKERANRKKSHSWEVKTETHGVGTAKNVSQKKPRGGDRTRRQPTW